MTNAELIQAIRNEIERLKSNMDDRDPLAPNQKAGYLFALADVLSFLSTLESEKPMNQDELGKEIQGKRKELIEVFGPMSGEQVLAIKDLARHFAEWGAEHAKNEEEL